MAHSDDSSDGPHPFANSAPTDSRRPTTVDTLFSCLANSRRRLVIDCLWENPGPVVVEEVVEHLTDRDDEATSTTRSDDERVEPTVALFHAHLPKLEEAGVVEVDHETNTVCEGDRFDLATSVLEVV